jgi:hypothetical protein
VAEVPFSLTATVYRDDGTVDTDFNGTVGVSAVSGWDLAGYGAFIPSSVVGSLAVSAESGVATFDLTLDPAPAFRLTLSASVPDPTVEGGYSTISTQVNVTVSPFPDQLTFIAPPPSSIEAGTPFNMTVAAVDASGQIDTSFNQLIILGGIDTRYGGIWGYNNPPIHGVRFAGAVGGVATFTGLSIEHGTPPYSPASYGVWSPDIAGPLNFSIAVTGPPTHLWGVGVQPSPNAPDSSIVARHAFSVLVLAMDNYGNIDPSFSGNVTIALADNPAGANLGGTLTVSAANGVARFSDLTLDEPGTNYTLQASSDGLSSWTTFPFDVQTTVARAGVGWGTSGSATLQASSDGLRLLPAGRTTDLPWLGIKQVQINLSQAATLTAADIAITSANLIDYGSITLSGSGTSYTITLGQAITQADRVTITIGNALIASFSRRLDVLPGDFNDDGVVNSQDMVGIRNEIIGWAGAVPTLFGDINGDGVVDNKDYRAARLRLGTHL